MNFLKKVFGQSPIFHRTTNTAGDSEAKLSQDLHRLHPDPRLHRSAFTRL